MIAEQLVDVAEGRGGEPYFSRALGMRDEVRAKLAALFGVEPTQVALTRSTTDGCNIVLAGLDLGPDDEIVTTRRRALRPDRPARTHRVRGSSPRPRTGSSTRSPTGRA